MILEELNRDFDLNITQKQINDLATDIYCEAFEKKGRNVDILDLRKLCMNNLILGQAILDFENDSEFSEAEDIVEDQRRKTLLAKGITHLVLRKLMPHQLIRKE